jgi:membrane protein implicated in regulation of membrane protease activity
MNLPGVAVFIAVLLIVQRWVEFPGWLFWVLIGCWIAKEVVLFPFVWRAYEPNEATLAGALVGECGIVKKRLAPSGYVQVRGELWRAERTDDGPPLEPGQIVYIHEMEGLTLYVVPDGEEES